MLLVGDLNQLGPVRRTSLTRGVMALIRNNRDNGQFSNRLSAGPSGRAGSVAIAVGAVAVVVFAVAVATTWLVHG